jgi:hypothetical protein
MSLEDHLKMTRQDEAIVRSTDCQYVHTDNIKTDGRVTEHFLKLCNI